MFTTEISENVKKKAFHAAFNQALKAYDADEVPVGSVILYNNQIIARNRNRIIEKRDPTAHAEILAIKAAAKKLKNERLIDCHLFTTLEPCTMCAGAIILARISSVFFLAEEARLPALRYLLKMKNYNHYPEVYFYRDFMHDSSELLKNFFKKKRK
ncbi:MAG: nucleoside deaminase [Spirochaetia bacterium]|nr:nucleoside deaminase [Spirochaetia bacterium]